MLYRLSYEALPEVGQVRVQFMPVTWREWQFFWALFVTALLLHYYEDLFHFYHLECMSCSRRALEENGRFTVICFSHTTSHTTPERQDQLQKQETQSSPNSLQGGRKLWFRQWNEVEFWSGLVNSAYFLHSWINDLGSIYAFKCCRCFQNSLFN